VVTAGAEKKEFGAEKVIVVDETVVVGKIHVQQYF
jgi:hypothetical protein